MITRSGALVAAPLAIFGLASGCIEGQAPGSITGPGETESAPPETGTCVASCAGRTCGGDGCGGSCGRCGQGELCAEGSCEAPCTPSCTGKECGTNGCGGSCGNCQAGETCAAGQCQPPCTPSCQGAPPAPPKVCGDDGCGGSCGACPGDGVCTEGQCPCVPSCSGKECGPDGCGGSCGTCKAGELCEGTTCVPCNPMACPEGSCGDDGCGGSCGICAQGTVCHDQGCVPACECAGAECGDWLVPVTGALDAPYDAHLLPRAEGGVWLGAVVDSATTFGTSQGDPLVVEGSEQDRRVALVAYDLQGVRVASILPGLSVASGWVDLKGVVPLAEGSILLLAQWSGKLTAGTKSYSTSQGVLLAKVLSDGAIAWLSWGEGINQGGFGSIYPPGGFARSSTGEVLTVLNVFTPFAWYDPDGSTTIVPASGQQAAEYVYFFNDEGEFGQGVGLATAGKTSTGHLLTIGGQFVVAGDFQNSVSLPSGWQMSATAYDGAPGTWTNDAMVARYDQDGGVDLAWRFGGGAGDSPSALVSDGTALFVAASIFGDATASPGTPGASAIDLPAGDLSSYAYQLAFLRLSLSGTLEWARRVACETSLYDARLAVGGAGEPLLVTGSWSGTSGEFDEPIPAAPATWSDEQGGVITLDPGLQVASYDAKGNLVFARLMATSKSLQGRAMLSHGPQGFTLYGTYYEQATLSAFGDQELSVPEPGRSGGFLMHANHSGQYVPCPSAPGTGE